MPPRRNQPPASPATSQIEHNVAPSPARSTRSNRGARKGDDEDWELESVQSSFKVPNSRSGKNGNANTLGLNGTTVNIANAFHTAQSANSLLTPNSDKPAVRPKPSKTARAPPPTTSSQNQLSPNGPGRAQSPSEQLAQSARALTPVRYFLRPGDDDETSGEFSSFSSLGNGINGNGNATGSAETSYDYDQEDKFVRAAQQAAAASGRGAGPRVSDTKKRGGRARKEDLPYRPAEDDEEVYDSDDSGGEGEGLVRNGALEGRAGMRGKRQEKGEGYLGMGLGLQPRSRRKGRKSGGDDDNEVSEEETGEDYQHRGYSPHPDIVRYSAGAQSNGKPFKSPTPVQLLRALTPRIERLSPAPSNYTPRRRQPSTLRTIVTNLLHGIALGLRFVVDLIAGAIQGLIVRPMKSLLRNSGHVVRRLRQDWWKWLGGLLALSLALRVLEAPWKHRNGFSAPDLPPSSMDELIARLTSLEQGLKVLSASSRALTDAEVENRKRHQGVEDKVEDLEASLREERKSFDGIRQDGQRSVKELRDSLDGFRREISGLTGRVEKQERGWEVTSRDSSERFKSVSKQVEALQVRVGEVERGVRDALDDGRLRTALERILPYSMPVKINSGGSIDIDPSFWIEMKKVLIGRSEIDGIVRKAVEGSYPLSKSSGKTLVEENEDELERWADKVFEKKSAQGIVISRQSFLDVLEGEVASLRHLMDSLPSTSHQSSSTINKTPPKSSVTIRSTKGEDITSTFMELIDAALLRYSKDTIARRDYALFTAGARVVPSITSDTLVLRSPPSAFKRWIWGSKDVEGLSPATALHPDVSVGSCWPFGGGKGQLGVWLNRRVIISDLTVEHASSELALDIGSAPKLIEVWALVEGEENKAKVEAFLAEHPVATASLAPSPDHLLLSTFTYDPTAVSPIQTFPVPNEIVELGIDVGIVIFKIESNWGGDFTCLYRVRVHGESSE